MRELIGMNAENQVFLGNCQKFDCQAEKTGAYRVVKDGNENPEEEDETNGDICLCM